MPLERASNSARGAGPLQAAPFRDCSPAGYRRTAVRPRRPAKLGDQLALQIILIAFVELAAVVVIKAGCFILAAATRPRQPGDGLTNDLILMLIGVAATLLLLLAGYLCVQAVVLSADLPRKCGVLQPEGGEDCGDSAEDRRFSTRRVATGCGQSSSEIVKLSFVHVSPSNGAFARR